MVNEELLIDLLESLRKFRTFARNQGMEGVANSLATLPSPDDVISEEEETEEERLSEEMFGSQEFVIPQPIPFQPYILPEDSGTNAWIKITGSTAVGSAANGPESSTTEWTYSAEFISEVTIADEEIETTTDTDAYTIELALNTFETDNRDVAAGGTFGNGIKWCDMCGDGFTGKLQPIQNVAVQAKLVRANDKTYAIFSVPNDITASCEECDSAGDC